MSATTWVPLRSAPHGPWARRVDRVRVPDGLAASMRLTSRGRALLWLAAALLVVLGLALGSPGAEALPETARASGASAAPMPVGVPMSAESTVVVRPGDSLWVIAARTFPGADTREAVVAFRQANGSDLASLQVGQRLVVPQRL